MDNNKTLTITEEFRYNVQTELFSRIDRNYDVIFTDEPGVYYNHSFFDLKMVRFDYTTFESDMPDVYMVVSKLYKDFAEYLEKSTFNCILLYNRLIMDELHLNDKVTFIFGIETANFTKEEFRGQTI